MNRRELIAVTAIAPVAVGLPITAAAQANPIGPIERRLHEFRTRVAAVEAKYENIPADVQDWMNVPMHDGLAMTPATQWEFAAFTLLGFMDDRYQTADAQQEALFDWASGTLGERGCTVARSAQVGPIERCYHEYRRRNDWLNVHGTDEDTDAQLAWIDEPIEQGMAMRPETVAEFGAYLLLATLDGMQMEGSQQSEEVIALAREVLTREA